MRTVRGWGAWLVALGALGAAAAPAQVVVHHGAPGGFVLLELGAIFQPAADGEAVEVLHAVDPAQRPAAYRAVELAAGDRILAVAGKRVRTVEALEQAYAAIAVGAEVELGVEHPGKGGAPAARAIVRFPKGDPAKMPKPQMRIVTLSGDADNAIALPALGAVLTQAKDQEILVAELLPGGLTLLKKGEHILALDDRPAKDLHAFDEQWTAIPEGAPVKLAVRGADGKERIVSFARPKPQGGQRILQN